MIRDEMIVQLIEEVAISALTDPTDYENACDAASRETEWSFPVSSNFRIHWMMERAKRFLFFYLATQTAQKFKVKQISLNQKFDHYFKMIEYMDKQFVEIIEQRPDEFADVDAYKLFGTKIDAGFSTDDLGRDTTYQSEQEIIFTPDEN
uniref:Uncharacterized protein n=1 Tax=viral metagenome TaxID=1070528 RepID=A0A6M3IT90_9ZZZZ